MKWWMVVVVGCLFGCGDDDAMVAVDAGGGEDSGPVDAGVDAPRPPPFEGPTGTTEGCGTAPEDGTLTIDIDGEERTYIVRASASNFSNLRFEDLTGGVTVYPQGTPVIMGANGWDLERDGKDVALFDALFDELTANYCIDRAKVFVTGFSYGGFFTNMIGCVRGDVIRAVAPVSAGRSGGGSCAGQAAAIAVHGTEDSVVPHTLGQAAFGRWLAANGCQARETIPDGEHCARHEGCDAPYPTMWCEHGGAHTYPSWVRGEIWRFLDGL